MGEEGRKTTQALTERAWHIQEDQQSHKRLLEGDAWSTQTAPLAKQTAWQETIAPVLATTLLFSTHKRQMHHATGARVE